MFALRWFAPAAGLAALVAAVGCSGGGGVDLKSSAMVSGVVTQGGSPINGAKVTFFSTAEAGGKKGDAYSATTDSSGKYVISGIGKGVGIPPGLYRVTIARLDLKDPNLPEDFDQGQIEASGLGKNVLPHEYENVNTTKLSVTLEIGKNENVNFDLKNN